MPALEVVLILGAVLLAGGSAGLLAVRISNPLLRGMGWVGAAFASGSGSCAGLLLASSLPVKFGTAACSVLSLSTLVLLQVAVLEMIDSKVRVPKLGVTLLCVQIAVTACSFVWWHNPELIMSTLRLLEVIQACQTATLLYGQASRETRLPARYVALTFYGFALLIALRSLSMMAGMFTPASVGRAAIIATILVHIGMVLAVGFGLFWMATTILTSGLEQMASTDPLTRIYNRRVFLMWCERELERSRRNESPFSILMVDLDRFKHINDRYGHQTGDEALCAAVEKMQDSVRGIDVLGRWGGEEFAVLLPHASAEAALLVAERVRASIARILLPARETRKEEAFEAVRVTASIGVATYSGSVDNVQSMVERADACLYQAKAQGRNRVITHFQRPQEGRVAAAATTPLPVKREGSDVTIFPRHIAQ
jgi:diguanylate cyclase (GGDEF)-like protein